MSMSVYFFILSAVIGMLLAICSLMISVCIVGLGSISRRPNPLPPLGPGAPSDCQQEIIHVLNSVCQERFAVRYIAGVYYVLTTASCALSDDAILKPLAARFPLCIFCVKRTLPEE